MKHFCAFSPPIAHVTAIELTQYTATTCLGSGLDAHWQAISQGVSPLQPCQFGDAQSLRTWIGTVPGVDSVKLPAALVAYTCRNNQLACMGLQADGFAASVTSAAGRYGADRVGVFLGSSTSGILETELAYRARNPVDGSLPATYVYESTHSAYSVADYVRKHLDLTGPAMVISTACSSSAKTFAAAARMLALGLIDAAVVGGVDSMCYTTLYGFHSLELTSDAPCKPYDATRNGLSLGEGAAFALLERAERKAEGPGVYLLGCGESSDAHHMSAPHPEGLGAYNAMTMALADAGLQSSDIDYINLHGTATRSNDAAEGLAVSRLFGAGTRCSSTKGYTGHTLGAAGGVEAVICALAISRGMMPAGIHTRQLDDSVALRYLLQNDPTAPRRVLSNSFGFGGSNCSLVFGDRP